LIIVKPIKFFIMSYEIVYDKQFIKVETENGLRYVPMVLMGSNNCYDLNGRRDRSWFPFTLNVGLLGTVAEYVAYWENSRKEIIERNNAEKRDAWHTEYSDKSFGYWTSIAINGSTHKTSYSNTVGLFKTGCAKALTIEQLKYENVVVVVRSGYIGSSDVESFSKAVASDKELLEAIAECNKKYEGTGIITTISFNGMWEEKPSKFRKKYFAKVKKEKVKTVVDETYRIRVGHHGYFVKETSRNLKYNVTGKVFINRAEVLRKLDKLRSKRYQCEFEIEVSNKPIEIFI
jgi:hypothetical protein